MTRARVFIDGMLPTGVAGDVAGICTMGLEPHLFDEIDYQEVLKRFKEIKQK